jgi:hypothetical protein
VNTFFRNIKLIIHCFTPRSVLEFKAIFPVRVTVPELIPLGEMEMMTSAEEETTKEDQAVRAKSPLSPRAQHAQAPPPEQRAPPKPAREQPPASLPPADGPEVAEDRGPEIPIDALRGPLASMHDKFVADFDERERLLLGKIRELEIRIAEKPQFKKPPPKKK